MRKFDYSFLKHKSVPSPIFKIGMDIAVLNDRAESRKVNHEQVFSQLEQIAKFQSVKSSNEIEGIVASDERLVSIINHGTPPIGENEEEIEGYKNALDKIHLGYEEMEFNQQQILNLHREIFAKSQSSTPGQYKTRDNYIMAIGPDGSRELRFKPVSAKEVDEAMNQLELAYLAARDDPDIHPLLLIPCVILDFLCIHPFSDGNGRVSRLLSLLLLYKEGYGIGKYVSFEEQINNYKVYYYEALRVSSQKWESNENNYYPFIEDFLSTLSRCYKELDSRFMSVSNKVVPKSTRIENTVFNSLLPMSKKEICELLPDVSPSTVEAVLSRLLKEGKIVKTGSTRNAKYKKSNS